MSRRYDAVVVGAGPAGSVTARELARRGHRVALLDRREFPRSKPCGDCLSPEAARVFDRIGLLEAVTALEPALLRGWRIWSQDGAGFTGTFERAARGDARVSHAFAISRERLDAALLDAARAAGAEVIAPLRVEQLVTEGDAVVGVACRAGSKTLRLDARIVIGADGLRSVVARRAGAVARPGRLRKMSFTIHPRLRADFTDCAGEMHVVPEGCIGIAPVERTASAQHNVTFVTGAGARDAAPHEIMRRMTLAAPALRDRHAELLAAIEACGRPLASGPFDRPVRFVTANGLALVGDAAGYYDPFTGQGVYQALSGAEFLAGVADAALRARRGRVSGSDLRPYAEWLRRTRRPARAVQRAIEFVTSRDPLMNRCARAIDRAPRFADALVAVTGDLAPPRALAGAAVVSLGSALTTHARSRA